MRKPMRQGSCGTTGVSPSRWSSGSTVLWLPGDLRRPRPRCCCTFSLTAPRARPSPTSTGNLAVPCPPVGYSQASEGEGLCPGSPWAGDDRKKLLFATPSAQRWTAPGPLLLPGAPVSVQLFLAGGAGNSGPSAAKAADQPVHTHPASKGGHLTVKTVLRQLGAYKRDTFLCIGLTTLEVIMEILLPFITARLLAEGLETAISRRFTAMAPFWWSWPC